MNYIYLIPATGTTDATVKGFDTLYEAFAHALGATLDQVKDLRLDTLQACFESINKQRLADQANPAHIIFVREEIVICC